jgi:PAS domain S-box-containing protein
VKNNQDKINRLKRVLRAVRGVSRLLVKEKNREKLINGICQTLIKNRGYHNVWIAILDTAGKLVASAQAGLGKEFSAMRQLFERGELPDCAHRVLSEPGVVVIEDPEKECSDCPLSAYYGGRGGMTIRVEHDSRIFGLLCVSASKDLIGDSEEISLLEEFAGDLAFALHSMELEENRRKANKLLRQAEKRYRSVFENTGSATLIIDEDMTLSMVNNRFEQLSGYSKKDVEERMKLMDFVVREDKKRLEDYHIRRRKRGADVPTEYEFRFVDRTGNEKDLFCKIGMIPGTKKSIASWVDISSLKKAEADLQQSEKHLRDLVENLLIGISIVQDGQVIYRNPEQKRLLGSLPLSSNLLEYENIHPEDKKKVGDLYKKILSGQTQAMETDFRFYPPDGTAEKSDVKWIYCRASVIEYKGKEAILVNVMDMTKAKELERMLMIQDKMASLGRVATGIAHEIRNPLTAVNMYLEVLNAAFIKKGGLEKEKATIERLQSASNKIESVIRRVMDFSKPTAPKFVLEDINHPIEEALKLSAVSLRKSGISVDTSLSEGLPLCKIDPNLIEEILLNLINNAAEAMKNMEGNKKIEVSSSAEKDFILVRIADSGPGVPIELRNKLFEPFYTTKKEGTGIGLSLVDRIVRDHGGSISVEKSEWGGAEFNIKIPVEKGSEQK